MDVKTSSRRTSRSKPRSSSAKDTLAGAVVPGGFLVGLSTGVLLGGGAERVALGAVGAASAAAGALVAKALTESSSWTATGHGSQCLSEIRKSLHLAVVPGVPFGDLVRQLLKAVDWMLSVEASRGDLASSARGFLGLDAVDGEASAPEPAVSRAGRCERKELRKHLRRLTALCASEPLLTHQRPCRPKRRSKVAPDFIGGVQREEAVAAALFNPKRNVGRAGALVRRCASWWVRSSDIEQAPSGGLRKHPNERHSDLQSRRLRSTPFSIRRMMGSPWALTALRRSPNFGKER